MASEVLINIIAVVVVLGIMILVHEWGHFVTAKFFGVRVEVFSIGFGPRLWGRKRGATDYRISALPLGGYVKMAGDNPVEERQGAPDEFLSRPRWQRAIIAVAGPAMNFLMAVVILVGVYVVKGIPSSAYLSHAVEVVALPANSPAAAAGLKPGDRVTSIDGVPTPTWEQAYLQLSTLKIGSEMSLAIDRGGQRMDVRLTAPELRDADRVLGYPAIPAIVDEVLSGMPADRAGLHSNDEILAFNSQPIRTWPQFVEAIKQSGGQPVQLLVRRGDRQLHLQVRPVQGPSLRGDLTWQVGVIPRSDAVYRRLGFFPAVEQATLGVWSVSEEILGVLGRVITGKMSVKQLQGVVGIARESGQAVRRGLLRFLNLMAGISLNLAILNLLPIPILDGGHILLLTVEGILRRDLSVAVKERYVQVGLVVVLLIFAIVMYNDVLRLIPGH